MAFPAVQSRTGTSFSSSSTTHNVAMPATVNTGDVLLLLFFARFGGTFTNPSGWGSPIFDTLNNGSSRRMAAWVKTANGSEGGTTVNVATSANARAESTVWRFTGASGVIDTGTPFTPAGAASPNPPNCNSSAGTQDILWLVMLGMNSLTTNSAPANYGDFQRYNGSGSLGCVLETAERSLNASSEDPGAFSGGNEADPIVNTLGVQPSNGTNVTPSPVVVNVRVVAPSVTLSVTPDPVVVDVVVVAPTVSVVFNVTPDPIVVDVLVVAPSLALNFTPTPVVVDVLVVAPTVTVGGQEFEVWLETWIESWEETWQEAWVVQEAVL